LLLTRGTSAVHAGCGYPAAGSSCCGLQKV
jgi:hypothetical protein